MKASEMIKRLQELIDEYGDKPVDYGDSFGDIRTTSVAPYTEEGNIPSTPEQCVQFFIH